MLLGLGLMEEQPSGQGGGYKKAGIVEATVDNEAAEGEVRIVQQAKESR